MLRKRGKKGIVVAIAFASLALTSVGFSTWIASYQTVVETDHNIEVGVEDTQRAGMTITAELSQGETGFLFDAAKNDNTGPIINSGTQSEDLTISFKITVEDANTTSAFNGLSILASPADGDTKINQYYNTYSTGENPYFYSPFKIGEELIIVTNSKTKRTISGQKTESKESLSVSDSKDTNGNTVYTVTINLGWGSFFNYQNPSLTEDAKKVDPYFTALNELKNLNQGKIKFTVTHPSTPYTTF